MGDSFTLKQAEEKEEGAWTPIPDNSLLQAKVLGVAKTKMPFQDKDTGADVFKVKFSFQVTQDGDFQNRKVEGQTSIAFVNHPECRLYQWVKALFGTDIPVDFTLDTDDLQELSCMILVEAKEKERRDGKGVWVNNNVIDVRPSENIPVAAGTAFGGTDYGEEPF